MTITRESLLKGNARRVRKVDLDGGETAYLRSLTEGEMAGYEQSQLGPPDKEGRRRTDPEQLRRSRARLVCLTLSDEVGNRLLKDEDEDLVLELDASLTGLLADAASDHVGLGRTRLAARAKNSEPTRGEGLPSS